MTTAFDFISTNDKPALLALSTPDWLTAADAALTELGYKVQTVSSHEEFPGRFNQIAYQVVIIEELFGGTIPTENASLQLIQRMPMPQRRHATIVLLGDTFETLNPLQAFQQSVHAVVNYSEISLLGQLVEKVAADNTLFFSAFRDVQTRLAQAKA